MYYFVVNVDVEQYCINYIVTFNLMKSNDLPSIKLKSS